MASKRWTANPARPKRYRPGKGEDVPSEDEDYSEEEEQQLTASTRPPPAAKSFPKPAAPAKQVASVSLSEKPIVNEDEFETESEDDEEPSKPKTSGEATQSASGSEDEGETSEEEEDETSSEDEAPRKLLRPTFIGKAQRQAKEAAGGASQLLYAQSKPEDPLEIERRKAAANVLVQEQLEKQAAARAAGKKFWDDDEDNVDDEVDDTDGLDPEAELAAWKLRELKRVKRARDAIEEAEREREEIERRRNLTAEERRREDEEHIEAQKAEREGKGQAGYMKKYFHKGAFFQDEDVAEELRKRDVMGARFADETNRELLPEYMQIRDMTKLGKKGRTRYKDLRSEDTGRWGDDLAPRRQRWNGDERFAPDERTGPSRSGANAAPVGERRPRLDSRQGDRDRHRRSRSKSSEPRRRYSRSRSNSPRRYRSRSRDQSYRKRSRSPYSRDRYDREKRRRVESG